MGFEVEIRFHGFALGGAVSAHLRFAHPAVGHSVKHTFDGTAALFSPSASLPAMAPAGFSQFVVMPVIRKKEMQQPRISLIFL
ncbi:MAG: hypothetical protein NC548_47480 [Lachnospiraceae bacterium]|nr:hypothetical protein [Lachnospiraceae bacterium]